MRRRKVLPWVEENRKVQSVNAIGWGIPAYCIPEYSVHIACKSLPNDVRYQALTAFNRVNRGRKMFRTCPGADKCIGYCYGQKGSYCWGCVKDKRALALAWTFVHGWREMAVADLERTKKNRVRIHDSGDFYSQSYLDDWIYIARCLPEKTFYAYTKSLHLDFSSKPSNMIVAQSWGGKYDHLMREYLPTVEVLPKGSLGCSLNSDLDIIKGEQRIYIERH